MGAAPGYSRGRNFRTLGLDVLVRWWMRISTTILFIFVGAPGIFFMRWGVARPLVGNGLSDCLVLARNGCVIALPLAGPPPYDTKDESRNVGGVALLTLRRGMHNNHTRVPHGAAGWAGTRWTFRYVIRLMARLGLMWKVVRQPRS